MTSEIPRSIARHQGNTPDGEGDGPEKADLCVGEPALLVGDSLAGDVQTGGQIFLGQAGLLPGNGVGFHRLPFLFGIYDTTAGPLQRGKRGAPAWAGAGKRVFNPDPGTTGGTRR